MEPDLGRSRHKGYLHLMHPGSASLSVFLVDFLVDFLVGGSPVWVNLVQMD
ncbi:hypothetical protein HPC62_05435 [Thermoleptolyngbya sichuanensis A183]|uniref:Uncharacterized protein n=2 Tax=Thermoleptolyngbya TaxID=2303528 RepID=A0A6M8BAD6_9CYAN|nr:MULTISPECIES: hypothetical protein [Thermoleptolyngbya]MDG2615017.1 hypothetical protein [Thermoleptolyngbya sichuanensis XZ-Cy5]QKD81707.1 hypothetical protein HPC62_05435 [Thermoleptolyngbya sichuanensis A183]WOB43396.1 hypothetical protein HNI00_09660 [Thermoleptolyngbya oregonensis NK1-22]